MANQPKKYKKFVATAATATLVASAIVPVASAASLSDISGNTHEEAITALVSDGIISGYQDGTFKPNKELTRSDVVKLLGKFLETKGYEAAADYKTRPAFADLTTKTNEELLKYASLVKEAGVFVGSNGNLLAGDPITRENMAITLVRTVNTVYNISLEEYVATQDFKGDVTDLTQAKAEARTAISVLDFYDITNPAAPAFNPKGNTTRGQFASFLYKTINADYTAAGQEDEEASSVLPTAITFEETSIQGSYGTTVTLKAKVTVKEGESAAKIPVKFDVYAGNTTDSDTTIVPQLTETINTDENGVATYTYTRSQGTTDTVNAYATGKPALKATAKVYWTSPIAITDVTEGNTLANNAKKVYQITGESNGRVYVAFVENLSVTPDKGVTSARVEGFTTWTLDASGKKLTGAVNSYPYEFTTGGKAVTEVLLDANGKANLVVSGTNATVTPVVYEVAAANSINNGTGINLAYSKTAKQVKGSSVTFKQTQILSLSVVAEGNANSGINLAKALVNPKPREIGGRDYVATVKTQAGAAAVGTDVILEFNEKTSKTLSNLHVYDANGNELTTRSIVNGVLYVYGLKTDSKGEARFTVTHTDANAFATPTVFIDNGDVTKRNVLDAADLQQTSEITYFSNVLASNYTSKLVSTTSADTSRVVSSFGANDIARFAYQLSDQNGKPRSYDQNTTVTFQVTNTGASTITVLNKAGQVLDTLIPGQVGTYSNQFIAAGALETEIFLQSAGTSSATVIATPSTTGLALGQVTSNVTFTSGATTSVFTVDKVASNAGVATADVVTLTFNENVNVNNVTVIYGSSGTVAAVQSDATNAKVVRATFATPLVSGTGNNVFKVSYAGKVYTFELQTDGTFKQI